MEHAPAPAPATSAIGWMVATPVPVSGLAVRLSLERPARVAVRLSAREGLFEKTLFDASRNEGEWTERWPLCEADGRPLPLGPYRLDVYVDGVRVHGMPFNHA